MKENIIFLLIILTKAVQCFQEDTLYSYFYEGKVTTGIPSIRNQVAGAAIRCGLTLQVYRNGTIDARLSNVETGEFNGEVDCKNASSIPYAPIANGKEQLEEPFRIFLGQKGPTMAVPEDEMIWVTNIKKSIMQNFANGPVIDDFSQPSVPNDVKNSFFKRMENTLFGTCETENSLLKSNDIDGTWTLVRAINFDNCSNLVILQKSSDISLTESGTSLEKSFQSRSSVGHYDLTRLDQKWTIEGFRIEGITLTNPTGIQSNMILTKSTQTLKKQNVTRSTKYELSVYHTNERVKYEHDWLYNVLSPYEAPSNGSVYPWIKFETNGENSDEFVAYMLEKVVVGKNIDASLRVDLVKEILKLLESAAVDLTTVPSIPKYDISLSTISKEAAFKIEKISHFLQGPQTMDVRCLFDVIFAETKPISELKQTLLVDAAAASGAAGPMKVLLELFQKGVLSEERIASVFVTLTNHISSPLLLESLLEYIESIDFMKSPFLKAVAVINFSNAIRKVCVEKKSVPTPIFGNSGCSEKTVKKFETLILNKANTLHITWHRNIWLEAVTRLGTNKSLDALEDILGFHSKIDPVLKLTAVGGLTSRRWMHRRDFRDKIQHILITVFENFDNDVRLRINSVEALLTWKPNLSIWNRMAHLSAVDKSDLFASYLYFLIEDSVAMSSNPKRRYQATMAQFVLPLCKKYSHNYRYAIEKARSNSLAYEKIITSEEFSWLPGKFKELLMSLKGNFAGSKLDFLNVKFDEMGDGFRPLENEPDEMTESPNEENYSTLLISFMKNLEIFLPITFFTIKDSIGIGGNRLLRKLHEEGSDIKVTKFMNLVYREMFFPSDIGLPIITKTATPFLLSSDGIFKISLPEISDMTFLKLYNSSIVSVPYINDLRITSKLTSKVRVVLPWTDSTITCGIDNSKQISWPTRGRVAQSSDYVVNRNLCSQFSFMYSKEIPIFYGHNIPFTSNEFIWPKNNYLISKSFKVITIGENAVPVVDEVFELFDNRKSGMEGRLTWRADLRPPFTLGNVLEILRYPQKILQFAYSPISQLWQLSLNFDVQKSDNKNFSLCLYYGFNFLDMLPNGVNLERQKKITEDNLLFYPFIVLPWRIWSIKPKEIGSQDHLYNNALFSLQTASIGVNSFASNAALFYGDDIHLDSMNVAEEVIADVTWLQQLENQNITTNSVCVVFDKLYLAIENMNSLEINLKKGVKSTVRGSYWRGKDCVLDSERLISLEGTMTVSGDRTKSLLSQLDQTSSCETDPFDPTISFEPEAVYDTINAKWRGPMNWSNLTTTDEKTLQLGWAFIWLFTNPEIERSGSLNNEVGQGRMIATRFLHSKDWSFHFRYPDGNTILRKVQISRLLEGILYHGGLHSFTHLSSPKKTTNKFLSKADLLKLPDDSLSDDSLSATPPECIISFNKVTNFANQSYTAGLSDCLTMATRRHNSENGLVLVRRNGNLPEQGMQVRIVNAVNNILDISSKEVVVNGKVAVFGRNNTLFVKDLTGGIFCTVRNESFGFVTKIFNGVSVNVSVSNEIRIQVTKENYLSGLCGRITKDSEPDVGPSGCLYPPQDYQLFIFAWTIPLGSQCDLDNLWNGKQLVKAFEKTCTKVPVEY